MCEQHYWQQNRMKSAQKLATREVVEEDGLPELIEEADIIFSRYIRLAAANKDGMYPCFICEKEVHHKRGHAMHFVPRTCLHLRWDVRNVYAGEEDCNCFKGGNLVKFAQKINLLHPGLTDILLEESRIIYKPSREEVRQIINEYIEKVKQLLKTTNA
jgi:hypothetical protein